MVEEQVCEAMNVEESKFFENKGNGAIGTYNNIEFRYDFEQNNNMIPMLRFNDDHRSIPLADPYGKVKVSCSWFFNYSFEYHGFC